MSGVTIEPLWTQGTVVAERFRLLSHVDDAPIGERWRADDGGTAVHLTALTPRSTLSPEARDELRAALSEFGHPHAVTVLATGVHDGRVWVATQITAGTPLRAWIADHRARDASVSIRDARSIFDQVTQCLAASHRADVALVHGFSLAGSVRVERRGEVQLVASLGDLGLLSLSDPAGVVTAGPPDESPTVADDIHGVGALLAEVLTDIKVTGRPDLDALVANLSSARPDVDPSLWKIVRACLSTDAAQRPANLGRVREMIRSASWTPCEIREVPPVAAPPPAPLPPSTAKPAAPERARIVSVSSTVDRTSGALANPRLAAAAPPPPAPPSQVAAPPPPTPVIARVAVAAPALPTPTSPRVAVAAPPPPSPVSAPVVPAATPVVLPVAAPTLAPASPRSFASQQTEATVLTTGLSSTVLSADETIEHRDVIAHAAPVSGAPEVTRRASNPLVDRVSALPKAARALFDEESTTLHVPSPKGSTEPDDTAPGIDVVPVVPVVSASPKTASMSASASASPLGASPLGAKPLSASPLGATPLAAPAPPAAPSRPVPLAERPDLEALIRREETAPESLGFIAPALAPIDATLNPETPTLLPLSRAARPATMAPPTPMRAAPVAEQPVVAPSVIYDAFAITEEPTTPAPRVATMPPPTARFIDPLPAPSTPMREDPASHTLPVPVRAMPFVMSPPPPAPRPTPPPNALDAHDEHEPSRSLFEPPLVWWFVAALAGVVTLLIAVAATSR